MNFAGMSPEQAMQAAAADLGLPSHFFDRMWAQESARGKNMRSPAGAEGHFQVMPKTRAELERRAKRPLNPDSFEDGLVMAHAVMKENLQKFKDPIKATAAYNGGWDEARWDNPETRGYIASLWDGAELPKGTKVPLPAPAAVAGAQLAQQAEVTRRVLGLDATVPDTLTPAIAAQVEAETARNSVGFSDVIKDKFDDSRANSLFTVVGQFSKADEDPNWNYWDHRDYLEVVDGMPMTDAEAEYLRENSKSGAQAQQARAQILEWRKKDARYGNAGAGLSFAAEAAVSLVDPFSWLAGGAAVKGFRLAKIGHAAMIAAGRPGAAVAAAAAESAVGNLLWEAGQDFGGQVKTLDDYAMSTAMGALLYTPFARGTYRQAAERALEVHARDIEAKAISNAETHMGKDPVAVIEAQANDIREAVHDASTPRNALDRGNDVAVPHGLAEEVRLDDGDLPDVDVPAAAPEAPASRAADEPMATQPGGPDEAPAAAEAADSYMAQIDALQTEALDLDAAVPEQAQRLREIEAEVYQLEQAIEELPGPDRAPVRQDQRKADGSPAGEQISSTLRVEDVLRAGLKSDAASLQANASNGVDAVREAGLARMTATRLLEVLPKRIKDMVAEFDAATGTRDGVSGSIQRGSYNPLTDRLVLPGKDAKSLPARDKLNNRNQFAIAVHEIVHAATAKAIIAVQSGSKYATPAMRKAYDRLEELRAGLIAQLQRDGQYNPKVGTGANYATKNVDEFVAQAMSDRETISALAKMPGKGYAEPTGLDRFWGAVLKLLGLARTTGAPMSAAEEAGQLIEAMIRYGEDLPEGVTWARPADQPGYGPVLSAPGLSPQQHARLAQRHTAAMYQHAQDWLQRNPINTERLKTLAADLAKKGGMARDYFVSDGLKMAASANPIVRMMAGILTETTTGAAGRRQSAAIRKEMLHRRIMGNSLPVYEQAYSDYRRRNGGGVVEDHLTGNVKRQFDKDVYVEILNRRYGNALTNDAAVRAAADQLQAVYQRSLDAQKAASTLGSGLLPPDAVGYAPQALRGEAVAAATPLELEQLAAHMSGHWQAAYGWSQQFSDEFSRYYLQRAQKRANGQKGVDFVALESPTAAVRDTLEEMKLQSRSLSSRARAELDRVGAQPQNKRRLDVDLLAVLPNGKRVLDYYSTDVEVLTRQHANRVAGASALAEFNVLGQRGVNNILNDIAAAQGDLRAAPEEVAALERVFAEFLGTPWVGERRSAVAANLSSLVRLQRLGGMGFTQLAEMGNMIHHLGFTALLKGVAILPQKIGEVGRLKRGQVVNNPWLTSFEREQGFEFGMEPFNMVARLDPPDELLRAYGKGNSLAQRLLGSGNYLQNQLSFFRGIMAGQHRMVAESIIKKAIDMIATGDSSAALRDMGIDAALAAAVKADLPRALLKDAQGRTVGFDITQLSSVKAQNDLLQAVHRGVGQIIQGSFIGERGAWAHDDVAKLILQLRTFGLTSMEKQWARTRMNYGSGAGAYGYAAGVMLAQMAFALPVYLARTELYSLGREDREAYLEQARRPVTMVAALMNYSSMSGLGGDSLELLSSVAGGWNDDLKASLGARGGSGGVAGMVPALGSIDAGLRVARGQADLYTAARQLPLSNLPMVAPILGLLKSDD